jgi:FkbM family methyltransferase
VKINFKKLNFLVEPKNYQSFWDNFLSWEQDDLNFVTEKGEQDKIFIDIGAWIGPYTLIAASMGMKVYAFEPDKVAFQELKKNIELNRFKYKPQIFNYGLSKLDAKAYLYSNTNDFGKSESGLINYKNQQNTKKTQIELKNFLQEINKIKNHNLNNKIKILKIDIEGGEFSFEKEIYDLVKLEKLYCIFSYHHMVFNKNKFKKNFYKIRTLFYQLYIDKIFPSKNIFSIANFFKSK